MGEGSRVEKVEVRDGIGQQFYCAKTNSAVQFSSEDLRSSDVWSSTTTKPAKTQLDFANVIDVSSTSMSDSGK